jgi:hypothetical protein
MMGSGGEEKDLNGLNSSGVTIMDGGNESSHCKTFLRKHVVQQGFQDHQSLNPKP